MKRWLRTGAISLALAAVSLQSTQAEMPDRASGRKTNLAKAVMAPETPAWLAGPAWEERAHESGSSPYEYSRPEYCWPGDAVAVHQLAKQVRNPVRAGKDEPTVRQITTGPKHHFFGYIGHVRTTPWNSTGRYIVGLQTEFQDRMPTARDPAEIILLDTRSADAIQVVERTRAWNFQQGTMLYWNPLVAETQFFFNDRDPQSGEIFTVLFDASAQGNRRTREYRFAGQSVANSGVAPTGGYFAAINYGRLARLRPVTGYPEAADWTAETNHPADDGVFVVDVATGAKRLLASFQQLAKAIRPGRPEIDDLDLFINHTLWSPDGRWIFFFCRGDFDDRARRLDVPFVVRADGRELTMLKDHFGGHPEWLDGRRMIGRWGTRQGIYDVQRQAFVGALGDEGTFADPGGDVALSLDGQWFVNGSSKEAENRFTFYRLSDGLTLRAGPLGRGPWTSGELRIDAAPCWNRDATAVLTTAIADDQQKTRQMFLIELPASGTRAADKSP